MSEPNLVSSPSQFRNMFAKISGGYVKLIENINEKEFKMTDNQLLAKPVIKNKFWIVEDQGTKVGTIQAIDNDGGYVFADSDHRRKYPTIRLLSEEHNVVFDRSTKANKSTERNHTAYDFPVPRRAYNILWNLQHQVAVFTLDPRSKSFYCAGYYLIQINGEWTEQFCPKLITLNRYKFLGPFKSQELMRAAQKAGV